MCQALNTPSNYVLLVPCIMMGTIRSAIRPNLGGRTPASFGAKSACCTQTSNPHRVRLCSWIICILSVFSLDDRFASHSPTQMVAHAQLTSSYHITEVKQCVEVLGKNSYQTTSVRPAVMGTWWNENGKNCEWHWLQKMRWILPWADETVLLYKRGFKYWRCKLCWTHEDFRL